MRDRLLIALTAGTLALASLGISGVPVLAADGLTFIVNSTGGGPDLNPGDGVCDASEFGQGVCTLAAAIDEANATPVRDRIEFEIDGPSASGVKTIPVRSTLTITQPLIITGYTQPGARPNTASRGTNAVIRIVLDGAGTVGLTLAAPTVVRGLVLQQFLVGIYIPTEGAGSVVAGNFVGTDPTGTTAAPNNTGIVVEASARIGGTALADCNLISGNTASGVGVDRLPSGGEPARILGNLIGTRADGASPLGNYWGVNVYRGTPGSHVLVGGATAAERNVIAFSGVAGVIVRGGSSVEIHGNSIFANGGLGIDLHPVGVTPNDDNPPLDQLPPPDTDTGANGLQNFPVITFAKTGSSTTTIKGMLRSNPRYPFRIEFFANLRDQDEAKTSLGSIRVKTDGYGVVKFTFVPRSKIALGRRVTATATDLYDKETSEISAPRTVVRR